MVKLGARELRTSEPTEEQLKSIKRNPIYLILDDVLDTYNVGALFRLADAVGISKVYLCGQTEFPPNPRIKKASVDTWKWIEWEYCESAMEAISKLKVKSAKCKIVAVEQDPRSVRYDQYEYTFPIALVVGNETYGVSKEVLDAADAIVELPVFGVNKSLNVMVSAGIVLYKLVEKLKT